jgi:ABC-type glutathione transport system ATPase component
MNAHDFTATDIRVTFRSGRGRTQVAHHALDGVSLQIGPGEIVGLVGESGSGKSTLARVIVGLQQPDSGALTFGGRPLGAKRSVEDRRNIQMVFQDPFASLDPRMTVWQTLNELLSVHKLVPRPERRARCEELMGLVQLPVSLLDARPHLMSGGQRQRVAIARALALNPRLLIADEAVAALDVSVQASIINLLADLREQLKLSILFISHDLAVVRSLCDRIAVIYLGKIVEEGEPLSLFDDPKDDYTQRLLAAVPRLDAAMTRAPD